MLGRQFQAVTVGRRKQCGFAALAPFQKGPTAWIT